MIGGPGDGGAAREPTTALVRDVPVLLEAEQQKAHVAPAEADALAELAGGQAGLVLERAGDEPEAVEDLDGGHARQRLPVRGAPDGLGAEESLRPRIDR
jgi:hypothetical protein